MKHLVTLFAALSLAATTFAQLTSPAPPPGVGVVTPTPTATPTQSVSPAIEQWHHYTINLAQVKSLGTGGTGTLTLDTLPANSVVTGILIRPTAALTGPGATTGTITVNTATGALASAYTVISITPGPTVFNYVSGSGLTAANSVVFSSGPLTAVITTNTTGGPAAVTAFGADVWVSWVPLP